MDNKGRIVQVLGPVVDVEFEDGNLPYIKDALEVDNNGKKCVMEVAQHIGNNTVRCIMLSSSDGLHRDMEVVATGSGIKVPVGEKTLGRLFNVTGQTLDSGESLDNVEKWSIHREPPAFEDQSPAVEILETGIKVIDSSLSISVALPVAASMAIIRSFCSMIKLLPLSKADF